MNATTRDDIERFAERVGSDPLLTQAAGGNVSWKDGNTLWVKSSGAWLEHARREDMFVPVDLAKIRRSIEVGDENYVDHVLAGSRLRPSIETALHALMPQTVVAHLHAIDALAYAVMQDGRPRLEAVLAGLDWMWVPYRKPGALLASQVASQLRERSRAPDLLVLGNHGVVFCASSVAALEDLIVAAAGRLALPARIVETPDRVAPLHGHRVARRSRSHALAFDPIGMALVAQRWVLYPDHAVFLGPAARVHTTVAEAEEAFASMPETNRRARPCVVVPGQGVWLVDGTSEAAEKMLDCYVDVCSRLNSADAVTSLSQTDVKALLNWEAEAYRKQLAH